VKGQTNGTEASLVHGPARHKWYPLSLSQTAHYSSLHIQHNAPGGESKHHRKLFKKKNMSIIPTLSNQSINWRQSYWDRKRINSAVLISSSRTQTLSTTYNKNKLDALISQIYFWNKTLHVSDNSSAHHQEFFTVHTALVYVIQVCWQLASRIRKELQIFGIKLYMFPTVPLPIVRSFPLYTQHWYISYRFADSLRAGSGRNCIFFG